MKQIFFNTKLNYLTTLDVYSMQFFVHELLILFFQKLLVAKLAENMHKNRITIDEILIIENFSPFNIIIVYEILHTMVKLLICQNRNRFRMPWCIH